MLVLISQRHEADPRGNYRNILEGDYTRYFESKGVLLLPVSNETTDVHRYFDELHVKGIILSGGGDVHPEIYGKEPSGSMNVSRERDRVEDEMIRMAIECELPVFGICRGMQKINVYFEGFVVSSISETRKHPMPSTDHKVRFDHPDLVVELGVEAVEVNSYHNYGITEESLSSKLRAFALSDDGIVEGLYHPNLPIAGVQWHPERKSPNEAVNDIICEAFKGRRMFWRDRGSV